MSYFSAKNMVLPLPLSAQGPQVSRLVAGVMKWGEWGHDYAPAAVLDLIEHCLDLGITTFDHADIYGHYSTEALFGEALKLKPELRERMILVSKCGINLIHPRRPELKLKSYDTSMGHILRSVDQSLKNLGTDYLDLLLVHRPSPLMHPDEVSETFHKLQRDGKVRFFGVSNFTPAQFTMLGSRIPLVTNQVEASLLHLDPFVDGTFDQMLQHQLVPMVWSPLGGGQLFADNPSPRVVRIRETATEIGARHGNYGIDQVMLAWLLRHPSRIVPVLGTGNKSRLTDAARAVDLKLTNEEWFELYEASRGEEVA